MKYSKIIGTGSHLPEKVLTNEDLEKLVQTSSDWILKRVGIHERHIVSGEETTTSLATHAAEKAISAAGLMPDDIDMIVVGTATGDYSFPSVACLVQRNLKITTDIPAFDVSAACAGFIYALSIANQYIKTDNVRRVLVIGVDALSKVVDWTDRKTCVLFGDGAGAVVIEATDEPGVLATHMHAAGEYADLLYAVSRMWHPDQQNCVHMEGSSVFKIAVTKLGEIVEQTLLKAGLDKSDIDWLIPHQANMRIIQATAKKLDLPMERVVLTIEHHGNTSAASVPLALDHGVRTGQIKHGETLLLEAFGAGLAWGAALVKY